MALAVQYRTTRTDVGTITGTPQTRGFVLNGEQIESVIVTKLTGDTSGSVTLTSILRPTKCYAFVLKNSAGADVNTLSTESPSISYVSDGNVTVSGLGNWTRAELIFTGRVAK
jgi:hypothetical protein